MYGEHQAGYPDLFALICRNGGAVPVGETCSKGGDCLGGDCIENTCRTTCCTQADCPAGQTCTLGIRTLTYPALNPALQTYETYCKP